MSRQLPVMMWFRSDLRLEDNPALHAATQTKQPIIPIYIYEDHLKSPWSPGQASTWWLNRSLSELNSALARYHSRLLLFKGDPNKVLHLLLKATGSKHLFFNQRFVPHQAKQDQELVTDLEKHDVQCHSFFDTLLLAPEQALSNQGKPYKVFTPFWKKYSPTYAPKPPLSKPKSIPSPKTWPKPHFINPVAQQPSAQNYTNFWSPGSKGAQQQLKRFLNNALLTYSQDRDFPAIAGTSQLSPYLHFGEISVRKIWVELKLFATLNQDQPGLDKQTNNFIRQLFWRDFANHLLVHFPHTSDSPLYNKFQAFPWKTNPLFLKAWQQGQTGYPIVDAGMRQLLQSGFMHNRVRMIVASFLTKDLLIPWQLGAKWFWKHLVDADLANNSFGWQWCAGCGADASPFFRIFNPITQSQKFDQTGDYLKRWLPELKRLPLPWRHQPWLAPETVLKKSKIYLGRDYPLPIVDHSQARKKALEIYTKL